MTLYKPETPLKSHCVGRVRVHTRAGRLLLHNHLHPAHLHLLLHNLSTTVSTTCTPQRTTRMAK